MKKAYLVLILIFILSYTSTAQFVENYSRKKALIIAIGNYNTAKTGWQSINSENDISLISMALQFQGFQESNIIVIKDEQADKVGIMTALYTLKKNVNKGDYVVIHYSGHGQQITDLNNDEIDGMDESIVPINAYSKYSLNYHGEEHITDDELGVYFDKLRQKLGNKGQVLFIVDACYSSTMTRGSAKIRGGAEPIVIKGKLNYFKEKEILGSGMNDKSLENNKINASFIIISASKFNEANYEATDDNGNGVGSLSFAFSKAFIKLSPNASFLSLFAKIKENMKETVPFQSPVIEGDYNVAIFQGNIIQQQTYFEIEDIISDYEIKINNGYIHGIKIGDKIGLYELGTTSANDKDPVISGIVSETNKFNSIIKFNSAQNIKNTKSYWAFLESRNVESNFINIMITGKKTKIKKQITQEFYKLNNITNVTDDEIIADFIININKQIKNTEITVKDAKSGIIIKKTQTLNSTNKFINLLIQYMKNYTQGLFIKNLMIEDSDYKIILDFIPVSLQRNLNGDILKNKYGDVIIKDTLNIDDYYQDGTIVFGKQNVVMLKITNVGNKDAFFNIIEINPDGIIKPIFPIGDITSVECEITKEHSIILPIFINGFYPPYGKQIYKVFADENPIDLNSVITNQGKLDYKGFNSFMLLVNNSYKTKGVNTVNTSRINNKNTGSVSNLMFITK